MKSRYVASWNYELLLTVAYPGDWRVRNTNGFMQSLLMYEDDQDMMTKSEYRRSFQNVKAKVIKALTVLQKKDHRLSTFIDAAQVCTNAHDLNTICEIVLDFRHFSK